MWRIFVLSIPKKFSSIEQLAIYLLGEQPVYFEKEAIAKELQERMNEI